MRDLVIWSISLIVGFPLLVLVCGELSQRVKFLTTPVTIVRNLVLPVLVLLLFLRNILKLSADNDWVKTIETLFWIVVIHASLALLNSLLFSRVKTDNWRSRVPKLLLDLSRLFLILLGTAIVLATVWKADLAGLVTALGLSSIVIGLALQDTLGSIMSGIALLFERPFSVGDWLRIGDLVGQVIDINWRSVRLQTLEREMVIIPHKLIGSDIIRNFSRPLRLHGERIRVGFSYKDPPNLAKQVLKATALETQGILSNPTPQIFTISYDDFAITYEVKFFIEDYGELEDIRDRFVTRIWYAAQRNNLSIPFPIRTLYHFHGPTSLNQGTEKKFAESLQAMSAPLPLDSTEITLQHFGYGERVINQNSLNNSLYVLISGEAMIKTLDNQGKEQEVMTLRRGEFFGEMSLFSHEPSPVSVISITDLEVMKLSPQLVQQMLERQPSFARELSQIFEARRQLIQEIRG